MSATAAAPAPVSLVRPPRAPERPMRIAVWHHFHSGGGKRALHDQVRGLVARGHHVEAWSPPTADLGYLPMAGFCAEHVEPLEVAPGRGRRPMWGRKLAMLDDLRARLAAMRDHERRCVARIRAGGFDLLWANSCYWFAVPGIGRSAPLPSALYLQEPQRLLYEAAQTRDGRHQEWAAPLLDQPVPRPGPLGWKDRLGNRLRDAARFEALRLQAREESRNVHAFDRVLCNSRYSRESLYRAFGVESSVCYLGVDLAAFPPSQAAKQPYIVGLGAFGPQKGIDLAIRAVAATAGHRATPPDGPPRLVWVGNVADAAYLQRMSDLAGSLGVRFEPTRMATQAALCDLLGRAAAMIYTSRLEPFGYAPLEANACGTVVVGLAEGGIRESIEPGVNGLLIDDGDPEALGQALAGYLDDLDRAGGRRPPRPRPRGPPLGGRGGGRSPGAPARRRAGRGPVPDPRRGGPSMTAAAAPAITVFHLVWAPFGPAMLRRFLASYRRHRAGRAHRLIVIFNGFGGREELAPYRVLLEGVPHEPFFLEAPVQDIVAYRRAAGAFEADFVGFLNSHSEILAPDWLEKLYRPFDRPRVGLVGATGSYESVATTMNRLPDGNYPVNRSNPVVLALSSARWLVLAARAAPAKLWRRWNYPPFPNPHLRTNAFLVRHSTFLGLRFGRLGSKADAWRFESGPAGLTRQVLRRGEEVVVVGADGQQYPIDRWPRAEVYRVGDQANLLVRDNRTEMFARADPEARRTLALQTWGEP